METCVDEKVKKQLSKMLGNVSAGIIVASLGRLFEETAEEAKKENDVDTEKEFRQGAHYLYGCAWGVDSLVRC